MLRIVAFAIVALMGLFALRAEAESAEPALRMETHKYLLSWIPVHCCVTNNCCFRIKATEVEPQPGDNWKILATGQVLARTNWSPDGKYWRCACDNINGKWTVHDKANTRCIFPPMSMSKLVTQ